MFGIVGDGDRLVDEQDRDAVVDAVTLPHSRVIQHLVAHQQERTAILWAHEYRPQLLVEHGVPASRRG